MNDIQLHYPRIHDSVKCLWFIINFTCYSTRILHYSTKIFFRKFLRNYRTCTIYIHRIRTQIMSSLPSEQCTFSLHLTHTGLDFAGPFKLKTSKLRNAKLQKGYAAIFVCLSTRAVHLEACSDFSTEAFLSTLNRFVGRRGFPTIVFFRKWKTFCWSQQIAFPKVQSLPEIC